MNPSDKLFNLTIEAFFSEMEKMLDLKLAPILPILERNIENEKKLTPLKIALLELKISKQTFYNWRNDPIKSSLLKPYIISIGKKIMIDISGIKVLFRNNENIFSAGKDYDYKKEASLTEMQKDNKRYKYLVYKNWKNGMKLPEDEKKELDRLSNVFQ